MDKTSLFVDVSFRVTNCLFVLFIDILVVFYVSSVFI